MKNIPHPSFLLKPEWVDIIRSEAPLAERQGSLTSAQLELIYQRAWFRLFVPQENSGSEITLPDALRLEEALCWADGSFGWTVTLCSGAGWFAGFLEPQFAKQVFSDRNVCLGGSGAPGGTARRTENGYIVSGRWKYATGADHLTHFTANCVIHTGDTVVLNEDAEPLILPFIFEKQEVKIIRDWKTIGLIATSSQSFEIKEISVSADRCFQISPKGLKIPRPIYKYPFLQFAEVTLAVNISGMAIHFLDCCRDVFAKRRENKNLKTAQLELLTESLRNAENTLSQVRYDFYELVERSWRTVKEDGVVTNHDLKEISFLSRNLASASQDIVYKLYPLCGLLAADPASEINRVWRDIHTASQHSLLTFPG